MNLTDQPPGGSQLDTLKTWLTSNAVGQNDEQAAALLNAPASPDYWVWRSSISREMVYHTTSPVPSTWNWGTYKAQAVTEQNAWTQMFMGDAAPIGSLNFRSGVKAVFSGSAQQNSQRDHVFAVGRRKATVAEKLFAVEVTGAPVDTGNTAGQPVGSAANPANLGTGVAGSVLEGDVTVANVSEARNRT